jgi:hypothetical protein
MTNSIERAAIILSCKSTLIISLGELLNIGCEIFKFKVGVIILSTIFCCVFIYAIFKYWQAVYSFRAFMSMFSGIRKWTVFFFLINILVVFITANSYGDSIRDDNSVNVLHLNKLIYSISFALYTYGQVLIFKQKAPD